MRRREKDVRRDQRPAAEDSALTLVVLLDESADIQLPVAVELPKRDGLRAARYARAAASTASSASFRLIQTP